MENNSECVASLPDQPEVLLGADRSFVYDHVFDQDSPQNLVYNESVSPLVSRFLSGYNATVLAYGQTGSGKTFSMGTGLDIGEPENEGIVPRAVYDMYSKLDRMIEEHIDAAYEVRVTFLELYNDDVIDLLSPRRGPGEKKPEIREDGKGGVLWTGVKQEVAKGPGELFELLKKGSMCRTTGSTDMNMTSSRSHAGPAPSMRTVISKFHFVDLAGSERLKKTNATGSRKKEGISINAGLLALGNVISALCDQASKKPGAKEVHVPYRDSKLTRLLQDSLGGNSQTMMLACVSPADANFSETLSTLRYAARARKIQNKARVNVE
ncbi:MAG: P-loop containing nucleoside triphosphate hydrolase protein, partial [Piptocephalis tieghemiana]